MNAIRWLSDSPKNRSLAQVKKPQDVASPGISYLVIAGLAALSWAILIFIYVAIRSLI